MEEVLKQEEVPNEEKSDKDDPSTGIINHIRKIKFESIVDCCASLFWWIVCIALLRIIMDLIMTTIFTFT